MKYMGSKSRIVSEILPIMLDNYSGNVFYDAFCGGCSVVENVPKSYVRYANDKQEYLIAMWKNLCGGRVMPQRIERDFYVDVRECYKKNTNKYDDALIGWVGFMGSYNGRFFDGGYSGHAVATKIGKPRDYITENINNTLAQVPKLKGVKWLSGEYFDSFMRVPQENVLIYCDPPYRGTKQYSISKDFDYEMFYDWLFAMKEDGHTIFVSEYEMPSAFKCIWQKELKTTINQTITKKPIEKLFTL